MTFFSSFRKKIQGSKVSEIFHKSGTAVVDFLLRSDAAGKKVKRGVAGMVKSILATESGEISVRHWAILRDLADHFSSAESIALLNGIQDAAPLTPEAAAELLQEFPEKDKLIFFFLALSLAPDVPDDRLPMVEKLAEKLGFSPDAVAQMSDQVVEERSKRRQLLRSGTGVLIVIGIILIFLMLATWLRPVAFGLIAAYLLLPLEKFFERRIREKRGIGYHVFHFCGWFGYPLHRLSGWIKRTLHKENEQHSQEKEQEGRIIKQAVAETLCFALAVILLIVALFSNLVVLQVRDAGRAVGKWMLQDTTAAGGNPQPSPFAPTVKYLNRAAEKFAAIPPVQSTIQSVSGVLSNPQQMRKVVHMLLKKSGGAFSVTAGFFGVAVSIAVDALLTLFFGIFFLLKIAEFCRRDESAGRQGEYLVRMLYNGEWLPGAQEAAVSEATRLTGGILVRLRIWIRGYLTLILIDMVVFTFFFAIFDLPYFPILGLIAGCSQLLPYIGPILTAANTLIVTLACGGNGTQLVLIILFYLIYNGVIEQFITYPAIIGDSLGLTTLETIIVVLLGATIAGIPGMILALPTASIAKYLVPQIYHCWEIRRKPLSNANNKL